MDFGDILSQWEQTQREQKKSGTSAKKAQSSVQKSAKKANAQFIEEGYSTKSEFQKNSVPKPKTASEQMQEDSKKKINPMELWLRRYGTVDKDKVIEQFEQTQKMQSRDYIAGLPVDAYIDLHGMTRDEAWTRLDAFTSDCIRRGYQKIMFIHGKGNHSSSNDPVLGELVRLYIEKNKMLGASGHPSRNQGGSGATWVLIKKLKK